MDDGLGKVGSDFIRDSGRTHLGTIWVVLPYIFVMKLRYIRLFSGFTDWTAPPQFLTILPLIRLLILGPYRGGGASRLKMVRNGLIDSGISNCRLVLDFSGPPPTPGERAYDLRKSKYWIDQADLLLFVFLGGKYEGGIALELRHALDTHREYHSAVSYLQANADPVSSLIREQVQVYSEAITQIGFQTYQQLVRKAGGFVASKLEVVYYTAYRRPAGEWENSPLPPLAE